MILLPLPISRLYDSQSPALTAHAYSSHILRTPLFSHQFAVFLVLASSTDEEKWAVHFGFLATVWLYPSAREGGRRREWGQRTHTLCPVSSCTHRKSERPTRLVVQLTFSMVTFYSNLYFATVPSVFATPRGKTGSWRKEPDLLTIGVCFFLATRAILILFFPKFRIIMISLFIKANVSSFSLFFPPEFECFLITLFQYLIRF